jgi:hypothetical protein
VVQRDVDDMRLVGTDHLADLDALAVKHFPVPAELFLGGFASADDTEVRCDIARIEHHIGVV